MFGLSGWEIAEIEAKEARIEALRSEVAEIRSRIKLRPRGMYFNCYSHKDEIAILKDEITKLKAENEQLRAKIDLQECLIKYGYNPSHVSKCASRKVCKRVSAVYCPDNKTCEYYCRFE